MFFQSPIPFHLAFITPTITPPPPLTNTRVRLADPFIVDEKGHRHYVPHLRACIARVPRLLACESAYYFPKDHNVCDVPDGGGGGRDDAVEGRGLDEEEEDGEAGAKDGLAGKEEQPKGAGNLVIHIRSGDIFDNDVLSYYGQVSGVCHVTQHRAGLTRCPFL